MGPPVQFWFPSSSPDYVTRHNDVVCLNELKSVAGFYTVLVIYTLCDFVQSGERIHNNENVWDQA